MRRPLKPFYEAYVCKSYVRVYRILLIRADFIFITFSTITQSRYWVAPPLRHGFLYSVRLPYFNLLEHSFASVAPGPS